MNPNEKAVSRSARDGFYRILQFVDPEQYDQVRSDASEAFSVRLATLDQRFRTAQSANAETHALNEPRKSKTGRGESEYQYQERGDLDQYGLLSPGAALSECIESLRDRVDVSSADADALWREFARCVTSMQIARQAWLQVSAFGWAMTRLDEFLRAYREAGEAFLEDCGFELHGDSRHPGISEVFPFWDYGAYRYVAVGGGNYLDAVYWRFVGKSATGKVVESLPAVRLAYRAGTATETGRIRTVDRLDGPVTWLHAMALSGVPRGARRIIPVSGVNFSSWINGQDGPELCREIGVPSEYWSVRVSRQSAEGPPVRYVAPEDDE